MGSVTKIVDAGDQESRAEKGTVVGSREGFLEEAESESLKNSWVLQRW